MNYTENHKLCQWEASDPIRRADLNADNAAIDAAIKAAEQNAANALAAYQQTTSAALETYTKTATGNYAGTGTYGSENPNMITFDFAPKLIIVRNASRTYAPMYIFKGAATANVQINGNDNAVQTLQWSADGKTVFWYSSINAEYQLNSSGYTYQYAAWG